MKQRVSNNYDEEVNKVTKKQYSTKQSRNYDSMNVKSGNPNSPHNANHNLERTQIGFMEDSCQDLADEKYAINDLDPENWEKGKSITNVCFYGLFYFSAISSV